MNKRGITLVTLIITIVLMIILATVGESVASELIIKGNKKKLISNMLLIQTKVKIVMENAAFNANTSNYVGEKLKDNANKQTIANGKLSSAELESDSIYIYNRQVLDSIGLNKIELKNGEVFLVDYSNSDIIYPKGCLQEDGSLFYRLSEVYNNLQTYAESYIQVVSFSIGEDYIDAEAFVSDVNEVVRGYQFKIGTSEEEARNAGGTWQEISTYTFENLQSDTNYYVIAKIKDASGKQQESKVYKVRTAKGYPSTGEEPENPENPENPEKELETVTEGDRIATIPPGFVASSVDGENTISGGLVIYEGKEAVTSSNHSAALTSRNQYVWIPVDDINEMIMCQTHGASVTLNTTSLQCPTCGVNTKLAGKLYIGTSSYKTDSIDREVHTYTMDFTTNTQTYKANTGHREPAVITGNNTGNGTSYDGASNNYHGCGTAAAFLEQLQADFNKMARSVAKYKGFYITRYEVGSGGASKKGQTLMVSSTNNMKWYGLYKRLRRNGEGISYNMIWRKPV